MIVSPFALALDTSGNIYVANEGSGSSITVYNANPSGTLNESPFAMIPGSGGGLHDPGGIAVH